MHQLKLVTVVFLIAAVAAGTVSSEEPKVRIELTGGWISLEGGWRYRNWTDQALDRGRTSTDDAGPGSFEGPYLKAILSW